MGQRNIADMLGHKEHATVINSIRRVEKMMDTMDMEYLQSLDRWVDVFDVVMPNSHNTENILKGRIMELTTSSMLSEKRIINLLKNLLKYYENEVHTK
jgi:hypothetical protein